MSRTRNTADLVSLNAINATGGKVGIGTTARSNQLYVKGSTEIIGILTATSFTGSGANLTNLNGSNISSGTVSAARVGALPASKITTGTFDAARIPTLNQNTTGTAALAEGLTGSPNITVSDVNVGGGLSVTGNSFFVGVVTFAAGTDGNIVLGDAATDNVVFNADVNSNIVPNTNNAYDLGSSSQKWRNLFISGNASIGGTLTYEDVTNIDSVGLSTFRAGVNITGTATATLFSGSGASLTNLPAANLTGTLPAISGANLTNLDASDLASGTVPDGRFPATLPAISGANLTNLDATDLASGTIPDARFPAALPAIDGSALTGITASGTGAIGGLTIKNQSGAVVGTAGSVSTIDFDGSQGVTVTATTGAAGIATVLISADVVTDTSPQLGGNLDLNGNDITGSGSIGVSTITTTGSVGVGSTLPTGKLDVLGQVNIKGSSTTTTSGIATSYTGSVQFDGTDDKLTTADSADYVLLQDFTFELWAYRTSDPNSYSRLAHWGDYWGNNTAVGLFFDDGDNADKVVFRTYSGISVVGTTSVSSNQWYHIAITRSGNTYRLFLDGNLEATTTSSTTIHSGSTTELCIASTHNRDTDEAFAGHISNARFVKGTALYTSSFTPQTAGQLQFTTQSYFAVSPQVQ